MNEGPLCGPGLEGSEGKVDGPPGRGFLRFLSLTAASPPRVVVAALPHFIASFHRKAEALKGPDEEVFLHNFPVSGLRRAPATPIKDSPQNRGEFFYWCRPFPGAALYDISNNQILASACSASSRRSSIFSMPTEIRTVPGVMPAALWASSSSC